MTHNSIFEFNRHTAHEQKNLYKYDPLTAEQPIILNTTDRHAYYYDVKAEQTIYSLKKYYQYISKVVIVHFDGWEKRHYPFVNISTLKKDTARSVIKLELNEYFNTFRHLVSLNEDKEYVEEQYFSKSHRNVMTHGIHLWKADKKDTIFMKPSAVMMIVKLYKIHKQEFRNKNYLYIDETKWTRRDKDEAHKDLRRDFRSVIRSTEITHE